MPLLLNIESATDHCSVCISQGAEVLSFRESEELFSHSKVMTLLIEKCFLEAKKSMNDLDAVAISRGPGSYTSLRVGSSVAKGICYALDKPLIAIDTLQSLALAAYFLEKKEEAIYVPMIDARRMEVYSAQFSPMGKRLTETIAEVISENTYSKIFKSEKNVIFCGNGSGKCEKVLESPAACFSTVTSCSALYLPSLATIAFSEKRFEDIAYYSPEYFKAPNITKSKKKLL